MQRLGFHQWTTLRLACESFIAFQRPLSSSCLLKAPSSQRRHDLHTTSRRLGSPLHNLSGLSASREAQHLSKERGIPRTEFSASLELLKSSEVDPFGGPGSSRAASTVAPEQPVPAIEESVKSPEQDVQQLQNTLDKVKAQGRRHRERNKEQAVTIKALQDKFEDAFISVNTARGVAFILFLWVLFYEQLRDVRNGIKKELGRWYRPNKMAAERQKLLDERLARARGHQLEPMALQDENMHTSERLRVPWDLRTNIAPDESEGQDTVLFPRMFPNRHDGQRHVSLLPSSHPDVGYLSDRYHLSEETSKDQSEDLSYIGADIPLDEWRHLKTTLGELAMAETERHYRQQIPEKNQKSAAGFQGRNEHISKVQELKPDCNEVARPTEMQVAEYRPKQWSAFFWAPKP